MITWTDAKRLLLFLVLTSTCWLKSPITADAQLDSSGQAAVLSTSTFEDRNQIECIYFARADGDDRWKLSFHSFRKLVIADGRLFMSGGVRGGHGIVKLLAFDLSTAKAIDLNSLSNSVFRKDWRKPPLSDLAKAQVIAEGGVVKAVYKDTVYFKVKPLQKTLKPTSASLPIGLYKLRKGELTRIRTREQDGSDHWYVDERGGIWIGPASNFGHRIDEAKNELVTMKRTITGIEPIEVGERLDRFVGLNIWQSTGIHAHEGLFPDVTYDNNIESLEFYSIDAKTWEATKVYEQKHSLANFPWDHKYTFRWFEGSILFFENSNQSARKNQTGNRTETYDLIREVEIKTGQVKREIRAPNSLYFTGDMCFAPDGTAIVFALSNALAEQRNQLFGNDWPMASDEKPAGVVLRIDADSEIATAVQIVPAGFRRHLFCADQQYVYFPSVVPDRFVNMKTRDKSGNQAIFRLPIRPTRQTSTSGF